MSGCDRSSPARNSFSKLCRGAAAFTVYTPAGSGRTVGRVVDPDIVSGPASTFGIDLDLRRGCATVTVSLTLSINRSISRFASRQLPWDVF